MNPYNGFSGKQRMAKLDAQHARQRTGLPSHPPGPCAICGDENAQLQAHDEDYSEPYQWEPPWQYALCHTCHWRLHSRFDNPSLWEAHKAYVRLGGCASDKMEFEAFRAARVRNETFQLKQPHVRQLSGDEWWEKLSTDAGVIPGSVGGVLSLKV